MSSEGHDWHIVIRQRVRREAAWLLILGTVASAYGWGLLGLHAGGGLQQAVSNAYVWAIRVGGVLFVALAAASLTGWRIWLAVDAAAAAAVAVVVSIYAVVAFLSGYRFDAVLQAICAVVLCSATFRALRAFRATDLIGLWGQRTDLDLAGERRTASGGPDAPTVRRSLAGELLQRTRRPPADGSRAAPGSERGSPTRGPQERSAASPSDDTEALQSSRPAQSELPRPVPPPPVRPAPARPQPAETPEGFLAALAREEEPPSSQGN